MRLTLILFAAFFVAACSSSSHSRPLYAMCLTGTDCVGTNACTSVRADTDAGLAIAGAFCTHSCVIDSDCAGNAIAAHGACYGLNDDPDPSRRVCYARCHVDADCDINQYCIAATGMGIDDHICLPQ